MIGGRKGENCAEEERYSLEEDIDERPLNIQRKREIEKEREEKGERERKRE